MKPILFNTEMVRAILDDRKKVTRRVVKPQSLWRKPPIQQKGHPEYWANWDDEKIYKAPYNPGDILYVRETWCWCYCWDCGMDTEDGCADETAEKFYNHEKGEWGCYGYRASFEEDEDPFGDGWRPSIHMPREAARIFLRVTDVRVERIQDITEEGSIKEGFEPVLCNHPGGYPCTDCMNTGYLEPAMLGFVETWNCTIKPADRALYGWDANPWVWAIAFERVRKEDAENGLQRAD